MSDLTLAQMVASIANQQRQIENLSDDIALLLVGRLRSIRSPRTLKRLKIELKEFNMHTGSWK